MPENPPSEQREKVSSPFSVQVKEVTQKEWMAVSHDHPGDYIVDMDSWVDAKTTDVIENWGASPCVIIYAKSPDGHMLSGHFLDANSQNYKRRVKTSLPLETRYTEQKYLYENPKKLVVPSSSDTKLTSLEKGLEEHQTYETFLQRIKELADASGSENMEIYLFGQNVELSPDEPQEMIDNVIQQARVTQDILASGIPQKQIADHRKRHIGQERGGDHTIYVPSEDTIYFYRSE